jgi:hypothetical protein
MKVRSLALMLAFVSGPTLASGFGGMANPMSMMNPSPMMNPMAMMAPNPLSNPLSLLSPLSMLAGPALGMGAGNPLAMAVPMLGSGAMQVAPSLLSFSHQNRMANPFMGGPAAGNPYLNSGFMGMPMPFNAGSQPSSLPFMPQIAQPQPASGFQFPAGFAFPGISQPQAVQQGAFNPYFMGQAAAAAPAQPAGGFQFPAGFPFPGASQPQPAQPAAFNPYFMGGQTAAPAPAAPANMQFDPAMLMQLLGALAAGFQNPPATAPR